VWMAWSDRPRHRHTIIETLSNPNYIATSTLIRQQCADRVQDRRRGGAVAHTPATAGIHQHGADARAPGADDVHGIEVADVRGVRRLDPGAGQRALKEAGIRLLDTLLLRVEDEVEITREPEIVEDALDRAVRIRDHAR